MPREVALGSALVPALSAQAVVSSMRRMRSHLSLHLSTCRTTVILLASVTRRLSARGSVRGAATLVRMTAYLVNRVLLWRWRKGTG